MAPSITTVSVTNRGHDGMTQFSSDLVSHSLYVLDEEELIMARTSLFLVVGLLSPLLAIVGGRIIDLSWRFDNETQYYPFFRANNLHWQLTVEHDKIWEGHGVW